MNTLVIVSHPYPSQSTVIRTLAREAESIPDVTVRHLETLYGNDVTGFDIPTEQKAHEGTERIVYLFPLHWFNLTPMMKAYFNEVWSYGWCYGPNGTALKGKEMLVVTSAGAAAEAYSHQSPLDCTMEDVLTPFKACAGYVGMTYLNPLVFYKAEEADEKTLGQFRKVFSERLQE